MLFFMVYPKITIPLNLPILNPSLKMEGLLKPNKRICLVNLTVRLFNRVFMALSLYAKMGYTLIFYLLLGKVHCLKDRCRYRSFPLHPYLIQT